MTFITLENFGHSLKSQSHLIRPQSADEILEAFHLAKQEGLTVTARGAGRSYNDASMNGGGIVLDLSGMNHILDWDPFTGVVRCEPGVTLSQLWQRVLPDGWWPPVVSGTMTTTLGGCLAANIHGKNNFRMGTIGEHVIEFTAILPTGAEVTCSPDKNADLFYSMISGLGMLGVFVSVTMQMKKIHSGLLEVHALPTRTLAEQLQRLEEDAPKFDYIVGWLDTITSDHGQIHAANYLREGEDPEAHKTIQLDHQSLPSRLFGVMPKHLLHYFLTPFANNLGWGAVNVAKYITSLRRHTFRQSHAAFHFLLDYIPNWERSYGRAGLIQYQSFLPKESALQTWTSILTRSKKLGLPAYLGVTKRHRPDHFLLTHGVDGFSLALDFKIRRRAEMSKMLQDFDKIVVEAGGRFYFAKNSETTHETALAFFGEETVAKFKKLKKRCDPDGLLESDLYRRVFG
ncbi:MAG: Decaprenylphosphoryl-beta-D-ribose oxidase [Anaerolineales bacterium]|nr:Decaprenylphosphoryl-beta-D-ribose oxidase [Anaerolineales bacterium]